MNIVEAVLMRKYDRSVALEKNWYRTRKVNLKIDREVINSDKEREEELEN